MAASELKVLNESITKTTIVKSILNELKKFNLEPKDYINLANSILDIALNTNSKEQPAAFIPVKLKPKEKLPIKHEDITIRKIDIKKDRQTIEKWLDKFEGKDFIHSRIDDIQLAADAILSDEKHIIGIVETDKQPIGVMGYLNFDVKNRKAELRKLIGDAEFRGKGLGKKATTLWLSYGITCLGLKKIYLYTFDTNLRNIRINLDMGFHLEGIFTKEIIFEDEERDIIRMALVVSN